MIDNKMNREYKTERNTTGHLNKCYTEDETIEIGVDEAGRGPLFGRVYTAAVILPKDDSFNHSVMKDSKKFHSKKKIKEAAEYIKKNAIKWGVTYVEADVIDKINIRQATLQSMHDSVRSVIESENKHHILVDGNDFKPFMANENGELTMVKYTCIEGGDNKYTAIAAASILAKVGRDTYIEKLCEENPYLHEKYDLGGNKGYGTAKHLAGIRDNGISKWHRKTYGICKEYA